MSWQRGLIEWIDGDTAHISVVFSWDCDRAYERAAWHRAAGLRVRIGGPGIFVLRRDFEGIAEIGGDIPDAVRRHNPCATFASRGCPVGCWFCIVPAMEGRDFTLIDDFEPRPILCDNNLSALPADFQDHIVARYRSAGVPLRDANSGFEPRTFDLDVYTRWKPINRGPWRFALDDQGDLPHVTRVLDMLRKRVLNQRRKRVYVLIGNEPFDACMDRIAVVLDRGAEPFVQPVMKLNARTKTPWVRYDWTPTLLRNVARWANWRLWKYTPFEGYNSSIRTGRAR